MRSTVLPTVWARQSSITALPQMPDPLGWRLDLAVLQMGVALRNPHIGMAEHPRDHRHRPAAYHRVPGQGVA